MRAVCARGDRLALLDPAGAALDIREALEGADHLEILRMRRDQEIRRHTRDPFEIALRPRSHRPDDDLELDRRHQIRRETHATARNPVQSLPLAHLEQHRREARHAPVTAAASAGTVSGIGTHP